MNAQAGVLIAALTLAPAALIPVDARAGQVEGRVLRGATAQIVTIEVTNSRRDKPIQPALRLVQGGRWIRNVRIRPDSTAPLAPGATRRFTVTYDVAPDAPAGAKESVRFEVTAPGERFDDPSPTVALEVKGPTTLVLAGIRSVTGIGPSAPTTTLGGEFRAEADLKSLGGMTSDALRPGTQVGWGFASALKLPPEIELGKDFTVGICSAASVINRGGVAPNSQPLEHLTGVRTVAGNTAYSFQQFPIPTVLGTPTKVSQRADLVFRYDAANSLPPDKYVYQADARATGQSASGSLRGRDAKGLVWALAPQLRDGLLGTADVVPATPAELIVIFGNGLVYGLDGRNYATRRESTEWTVQYRLKPEGAAGDAAAAEARRFASLPDVGADGCPDIRLDGRTLTGVPPSPPPPMVAAPPPPPGPAPRFAIGDYRQRTGADAQRMIQELGMRATPRIGAPAQPNQQEYVVVSQEPAPGTLVALGSEVVIVLTGPRPAVTLVSIPDLRGMTGEQAQNALASRGLRARPQVGRAPSGGETPFTVLEQNPRAGQSIPAGGDVDVVLLGAAAAPPPAPAIRPSPVVAPPAPPNASAPNPVSRPRQAGPVRVACPVSPTLGPSRYLSYIWEQLPKAAGFPGVWGPSVIPPYPSASPTGAVQDGTWCFRGFCAVGCAYGPASGSDNLGIPVADVRVFAAWWASEDSGEALRRACFDVTAANRSQFGNGWGGPRGKPAVVPWLAVPSSMASAGGEATRLRAELIAAVSPNALLCP